MRGEAGEKREEKKTQISSPSLSHPHLSSPALSAWAALDRRSSSTRMAPADARARSRVATGGGGVRVSPGREPSGRRAEMVGAAEEEVGVEVEGNDASSLALSGACSARVAAPTAAVALLFPSLGAELRYTRRSDISSRERGQRESSRRSVSSARPKKL